MFDPATTAVLDYLTPEQAGSEAHETISLQVALNALGNTALREDYPPVVRRSQDLSVNLALRSTTWSEACSLPGIYMPTDSEERLYFLPWAV
jgi:hypothetical protein